MLAMQGQPNIRRLVIESLIIERILALRTAEIEVGDAELDAFVAETWEKIREADPAGSRGFDSLEAFLEKRGVPVATYRESLKLQLATKRWVERKARVAPGVVAGGLVRSVLADAHGSDEAALRAFLARHRARYDGSQVRASQIIVDVTRDRGPTEARALIEKLRAKALEDDADFAAIARESSDDPAAPFTGGDLNFFARHGGVLEPLAATAFDLEVGAVSDPIAMPRGFAIVKVTAARPGEPVELTGEVKERVTEDWLGVAIRDVVGRWRRKAKVEIVGE